MCNLRHGSHIDYPPWTYWDALDLLRRHRSWLFVSYIEYYEYFHDH